MRQDTRWRDWWKVMKMSVCAGIDMEGGEEAEEVAASKREEKMGER